MLTVLGIVVAIVIAEAVFYLLYTRSTFTGIKNIYNLAVGRKAGLDDVRTFNARYTEHPFLILIPNPTYKNSFGDKIHNKYGFRHNNDFTDIGRTDKALIYCAGESSTYCNFIERNAETWPYILEEYLRASMSEKEIEVVNGACSGWTSLQSLIRLIAWIDVLKPRLVVVYHGKNDFTPFVNGKPSISEIFPDYGNVMNPLRFNAVNGKLPALARYSYIAKVAYGLYVNHKYPNVLLRVYDQKRPPTQRKCEDGLKRIGAREREFIISRYRSFAALCCSRDIPVLFVTQKVVSRAYGPYMDRLNDAVRALENRSKGCYVYDFSSEMKDVEGIVHDTVHFTKEGARVCGARVGDFIMKDMDIFK